VISREVVEKYTWYEERLHFYIVPWVHCVAGIFALLMGVEAHYVVMRARTSVNASIHKRL
jgi:hypothetical protein